MTLEQTTSTQQQQFHMSPYNHRSTHLCTTTALCICPEVTYPVLCGSPKPHRRVPKDNSLLCTFTSRYLRSWQWHCWRFKCCGTLSCVTGWVAPDIPKAWGAFIFNSQAAQRESSQTAWPLKMKREHSFLKSRTTHPTTLSHIHKNSTSTSFTIHCSHSHTSIQHYVT